MPVLKPIGYHLGVCAGNGTAGNSVKGFIRVYTEIGWNRVKLIVAPIFRKEYWGFCFYKIIMLNKD